MEREQIGDIVKGWTIMPAVLDNILQAIGGSPVVALKRVARDVEASVLAKVEGLNPGGSIKARTALGMIEAAEREGLLGPNSIIVEATSGNQGIGLAMVGAVKGYRVRIVMPASMSMERRLLIGAYGAEVVLVPDRGDIGESIDACLRLTEEMAREDRRVFLPRQFANQANPAYHRLTTAAEIISQVGRVDAFVCGIGTGGTLTGVGEVLKERWPQTLVVAVEPENAAILSGGRMGCHVQQGIGDGLVPPILNRDIIDEIEVVSDGQALAAARRLAREEGILAGVSSGSNCAAALNVARRLGKGKTVLTVLPDTGERYLSTELFAQEAQGTRQAVGPAVGSGAELAGK